MKPKFRNSFLLSSTTLALFASPAAQAVPYYWDNTLPIETAGFGTAGGTWGTDAFWSASSAGTDPAGIAGPLLTDDLNFGTVANVLGAGTVTVSGTQSANSLTFGLGSGLITLAYGTDGTINLAAAAVINVDSAAGAIISSDLTGAGTSLTKTGSGTLTLSGINGYAGTTFVNSVGAAANTILTVSNDNALGTTAGGTTLLGSNVTSNGSQLSLTSGITVTDETLTMDSTASGYRASLITTGTATWDGNVVVNGTGGLLAFHANAAAANLTVGSSADDTVTGSNTLYVRGTGIGTVNSTINNGAGGVIKTDSSTWTLAAANTYTGPTTIAVGTLSINSILDVNGGPSPLGAPTTVFDGTINIGQTTTSGGTLLYNGTGHTTNRVINLIGTSGGVALTQSGLSGLLKFTSDFTATGNGGKTLTLQGSAGGAGEISGAIVNNGTVTAKTTSAAFASAATTITLTDVTGITTGSRITGTGLAAHTAITAINTTTNVVTISPGATSAGTLGQTVTVTAITSLTKAGTGTWTLSGTNTYTGTTSLNAGVLRLGSAGAIPGGIATTGGTGGLTFNAGILGLDAGDFTRSYNATQGTIGAFSTPANAGAWWAAYGADRIVNVGGAGAATTFFNGKPINFGAADSTHMVEFKNGLSTTSVTRLLVATRGITPGGVDGLLSGVITQTSPTANMCGLNKTGNGTMALTGASTITGRIQINTGTIVVNSLASTGSPSPIGQGLSGIGLAGGTFRYAPVTPAGGVATGGGGHSTDHNFTITASSTMDASGTGALVFNAPIGNIISPDVTTLTFSATGANKQLTALATTSSLAVGMAVTGTGIAVGSTISSIDSATAVTLISSANVALSTGVAATFGTPSARTLTLIGTNTDANTIAGILQDSSATGAGVLSLTKTGSGSWNLSGANTYTGATTVSAGTLSVNGSISNSPVTLSSGTLTGSGTLNTVNVEAGTGGIISNNNGVAGAALTIGALTFDGAATVNTFSNSAAAAIVTTSLATNAAGTVTINPGAAMWADGATYNLISYGGGSIGGGGFGQFALGTISNLSARQSASALGNTGTAITLTIAGDTPFWSGDGDDKWNLASANNWKLVSNNNLAVFLATDNVRFNDNATGAGPINVDIDLANVATTSTTFNNSGKDYVLNSTGGFGISSGSLIKSGSGKVTLNTANTYAGGTTLNSGTLVLGNASAIGTGTLTINGGKLDSSVVDLINSGNNSQAWNSNFEFVGTQSLDLGTGAVTMSADRTVTVSANTLTVGGAIGGGTFGLTKLGAGTLLLKGTNTFTGTVAVTTGTLALSPTGALTMANTFTGTGTLNINPGSTNLQLTGDLSGFTGIINVAPPVASPGKLVTGSLSPLSIGTIVNVASGGTWFTNNATQTGIIVNLSGPGNAEGFGAFRTDTGTLDSTSSVVLQANSSIGGNTAANTGTINAIISENVGPFALTKLQANSIVLGGANTYTGLTTVSAGVLILQNASALGTTAAGTSVANAARVELDNLTVTGEALTLVGAGGDNLGALKGRSGTSVWAGPVTIDADQTRIGVVTGASLEVSGAIDDGLNDYRVIFRPQSATATVIVSGANTYTGGTTIMGGPVVANSLNRVVGGTTTSNFGAPVTAANGMLIIGQFNTTGTLSYTGAGETTDRTVQIGANTSPTPVVGDTGSAGIENNGTASALVFSAPNFNTPTNNTINAAIAPRSLTLGGTNTAANTIAGIIQNNQVAGAPTAAVALAKTGSGNWTLSGANTYTGGTAINGGTLVITGATQSTNAITFSGGGILGLDIAAPVTAANATVDFTGQSVLVTGSPTLASYTLLTASSILGTAPTLAAPAPAGYSLEVVGNALRLVQTGGDPFLTWSGAADFDTDSNGDGVKNGLAWLLGAPDKNANAVGLLPKVTQSGGNLIMNFTCLKLAGRGTVVLKLQHSKDLGLSDPWTVDEVLVPDTAGVAGVTDVVTFTVPTTNGDVNLVNLQATIPASAAATGTKLFGRLRAVK